MLAGNKSKIWKSWKKQNLTIFLVLCTFHLDENRKNCWKLFFVSVELALKWSHLVENIWKMKQNDGNDLKKTNLKISDLILAASFVKVWKLGKKTKNGLFLVLIINTRIWSMTDENINSFHCTRFSALASAPTIRSFWIYASKQKKNVIFFVQHTESIKLGHKQAFEILIIMHTCGGFFASGYLWENLSFQNDFHEINEEKYVDYI